MGVCNKEALCDHAVTACAISSALLEVQVKVVLSKCSVPRLCIGIPKTLCECCTLVRYQQQFRVKYCTVNCTCSPLLVHVTASSLPVYSTRMSALFSCCATSSCPVAMSYSQWPQAFCVTCNTAGKAREPCPYRAAHLTAS